MRRGLLPSNHVDKEAGMRSLTTASVVCGAVVLAFAQNSAVLTGTTKDCFAGKIIHPAGVEVYVLDAAKSGEVLKILNDLEKEAPHGNEQNVQQYFASYEHLVAMLRKSSALGEARSSSTGKFSVKALRPKTKIVIIGIAEREDDPAYYGYTRMELSQGVNPATLDFDRGSDCKPTK